MSPLNTTQRHIPVPQPQNLKDSRVLSKKGLPDAPPLDDSARITPALGLRKNSIYEKGWNLYPYEPQDIPQLGLPKGTKRIEVSEEQESSLRKHCTPNHFSNSQITRSCNSQQHSDDKIYVPPRSLRRGPRALEPQRGPNREATKSKRGAPRLYNLNSQEIIRTGLARQRGRLADVKRFCTENPNIDIGSITTDDLLNKKLWWDYIRTKNYSIKQFKTFLDYYLDGQKTHQPWTGSSNPQWKKYSNPRNLKDAVQQTASEENQPATPPPNKNEQPSSISSASRPTTTLSNLIVFVQQKPRTGVFKVPLSLIHTIPSFPAPYSNPPVVEEMTPDSASSEFDIDCFDAEAAAIQSSTTQTPASNQMSEFEKAAYSFIQSIEENQTKIDDSLHLLPDGFDLENNPPNDIDILNTLNNLDEDALLQKILPSIEDADIDNFLKQYDPELSRQE